MLQRLLRTWWGRGLLFSAIIAVLMAVLDPLFALQPPQPARPTSAAVTPTHRPATPTLRPSPTPTATPTPPPRPAYDLHVRYDFLSQQMEVREDVTYTNTTGWPLEDLVFIAQPRWYAGVFQWEGAWQRTAEDGWQELETEMRDMSVLVRLPRPLRPAERLSLRLRYRLSLPALQPRGAALHAPRALGYTARQVLWTDWYLFLPPYDPGRGWRVHTPWYFGEHLVYPQSDVQVALEIYNPPPDLTIASNAASIPCPEDRPQQTCYRQEATRGVVFFFSPYFIRLERTLGQVRLEGYFFPLESAYGQDVLDAVAEALETFGEYFGPYHRDRYIVVQADLPDGMEYDGAALVSYDFFDYYNGQPWSLLIAISVHETAHQWWFAQVHSDQALHPWLDESLATYSELLYYEARHPAAVDWWWTYRVDYYRPGGALDQPIYAFETWRAYRDTIYLHGAHFWHDLRQRLGDDAFFAFLQDYRGAYAGHIATPQDWATALQRHLPSNEDLQDLWRTFFTAPPRIQK